MIKSVQNIDSNQPPSQINSKTNGINENLSISQNDFSNMIETQKTYKEMGAEIIARLRTSQEQITESQLQIRTLLEIIQKKI